MDKKPQIELLQTTYQSLRVDSRQVQEGDLFVALKGARVDGHHYVSQAIRKGATHAIIDKEKYSYMEGTIKVKDAEIFMRDLVLDFVSKTKGIRVGITGSCGKTTFKDLLYQLFSQKYWTNKTRGNYNTEIGLPLSVFEWDLDSEIYVGELGASKVGDIASLCELFQPHIGILTNVSPSHLEGFGSLENIYKTKCELAASIAENKGLFFYCCDDKNIDQYLPQDLRKVTWGFSDEADFRMTQFCEDPDSYYFSLNDEGSYQVEKEVAGNVLNIAGVFALALTLGYESKELESFRPQKIDNQRFISSQKAGCVLIDDTYNANPASFENAIRLLSMKKTVGRKILISGDMAELGEKSLDYHFDLGAKCFQYDIDVVFSVGDFSEKVSAGFCQSGGKKTKSYGSDEKNKVVSDLLDFIKPGDVLLFKGSRSQKIDQILQMLQNQLGDK